MKAERVLLVAAPPNHEVLGYGGTIVRKVVYFYLFIAFSVISLC